MSLTLRPYPIKHSLAFCEQVHRRLPKLQGAMWAIGCFVGDELRGVSIVGRPTARMLDDGRRLQVLRCAVIEGTRNGCSILYGASSRAAKAMGAASMLTYIHDDESGVSLRAAGWVEDTTFVSTGGEWARPSRSRPRPSSRARKNVSGPRGLKTSHCRRRWRDDEGHAGR